MVNLVAAVKPLIHGFVKMAGIVPHTVQIDPGTFINIWVPQQTLKKTTAGAAIQTTKPAVLLLHGFAADGITNWLFQVRSLTKKYSVYVPDLLFFGGSTTESPDRSPTFQAECLVKGLRKLGVERCRVVGFSYGGMVAFKMAELQPEMVEALVITGMVRALTESISAAILERLQYSSFSEFLMPESVAGCRALLRVAMCRKLWLPHCLYKDLLQTVFIRTKERGELLEALVVPNEEGTTIPTFHQRIHLVWGEQDEIFKQEVGRNLKEELGDKATFQVIEKAGHLLHLERPSLFNKCLHHLLASVE